MLQNPCLINPRCTISALLSVVTIFADEKGEFWQQYGEGGHIAEHEGEGGHVADEGEGGHVAKHEGGGGDISEHHQQQNQMQIKNLAHL